MINSLDFPDGIKWKLKYITGGDFLGAGVPMTECLGLYIGAKNSVVDVKFDTSGTTNTASMFKSCTFLKTITEFDTSNVTDMQSMFYGCNKLISIPQLNTSNVTNMDSMFYQCTVLTSIPQLDTSKVTNMQSMFYYDRNLISIPQLDMSNVTNVTNMLYGCESGCRLWNRDGCSAQQR